MNKAVQKIANRQQGDMTMAKTNGGNGTNQQTLSFDIKAWQSMGQEHIGKINVQIDERDATKRVMDEQIAVLVEERTTIEKTLGIYKGRGNGKTRVQVKPVILRIFAENEGQTLDWDAVVEKVQAVNPKANEKKIRGTFDRFVKKDTRFAQNDKGWVYTATP